MAFAENSKIINREKTKMSTEEQLRICKSQSDQLERENARLVDQLKEVIRMNSHWQRYDAQREEYVLKLTRTNHELQDKVEELQSRKERRTEDAKGAETQTGPAAESAKSGEDDVGALRKEEEVAALVDQIAKLKDRIVELEKKRDTRKKEEDDEIALLHAQVNVFVEDFKQERKDRERIHGENLKLRKRLALAERQINVYEEKISQLQGCNQYRPAPVSKPPPRGGYDEPCCYPEDRPHRGPYQGRNHARRYYGDDLTDLPSDVEIDGMGSEEQEDTNGMTNSLTEENTNGEVEEDGDDLASLQCPRCLTSFEQNNDFLKHVDKCID